MAVEGRARKGVEATVADVERQVLERVASVLEAHEGRQRSAYKLATLGRRVARRCAARELSLGAYADLLEQSPLERAVLAQELLVGATGFFRDPPAFAALGSHLAAQLASKPDGAPVRVWCAGCAGGEEAYSLAMLVHDVAAELDRAFEVRVFATDIDEQALGRARAGLFDASATVALSAESLARFECAGRRYRINSEIRSSVVFGHHDLLVQPPFRRLDLISCRNVLIYLEPATQQQVLARFHAGLEPGGTLFLGPSESVGLESDLFASVDRRNRIFRRLEGARAFAGPFGHAGPSRQELEARVGQLVARHRELEAHNADLRRENLALRRRLAELQADGTRQP